MSETRFQLFARIASAPYFSKLDAFGLTIGAVHFHQGWYLSAFVYLIILMTISTILGRESSAITNTEPHDDQSSSPGL